MKVSSMHSLHRSAFTLVELSIVLVILGLLTGGILTGQSLIRAAEMRSVVTEFQRYQAAVQSFRDKYRALPGDMKNATAFWGKDNAVCSGDTGVATVGGTCNGTGNGMVGYDAASLGWEWREPARFWTHLALAGMIEGSYPSTSIPSAGAATADGYSTQMPAYHAETIPLSPTSRMGNTRWFTGYHPRAVIHQMYNVTFATNYGHYFIHGQSILSGGWLDTFQSVMKPEEVWNIDSKMDDGKPGIGKVIGYPYTCTTAANVLSGSTAEYLLTSTTGQCGVIFANAY